jgi:hypothetical protein
MNTLVTACFTFESAPARAGQAVGVLASDA